jgi:hypothetical protein
VLVTNGLGGEVRFDVTADVVGMLVGEKVNHGWLVRKRDENEAGLVEFGSRHGLTPPRLEISRSP